MRYEKYHILSIFLCCVLFFLISLAGTPLPVFSGTSPAEKTGTDANVTKAPELSSIPSPTEFPSPTESPTKIPTSTPEPTEAPSPTLAPTEAPTKIPAPTEAPSPTPAPTEAPSPTPEPFSFTKGFANVDDFVNVREQASTNSKLLGKLLKDGIVEVLGTEGEWTKISSGKLTGYIFSEYLHLGADALSYADRITAYNAVVNAKELNVRTEPNTSCKILGAVTKTNAFPALLSKSTKEWIAIQYTADTVAYVYAEYVDLICNQKEAMTLEELAAAEKAAKIEKARVKSLPVTYRDPITVSDEDFEVFTLVVAAESYWEPYDGKLAVANVILNRLLTGSSDTIYDVVTAPGQFEGYQHIDKYKNRDLTDCINACKEALSGKNNIGTFRYFHADTFVDSHDEWASFTSWYQLEGHVFFLRAGW